MRPIDKSARGKPSPLRAIRYFAGVVACPTRWVYGLVAAMLALSACAAPGSTTVTPRLTVMNTVMAADTPVFTLSPSATLPIPMTSTPVLPPTLAPTTTPTPPFNVDNYTGDWTFNFSVRIRDAHPEVAALKFSGGVRLTVQGSGLITGLLRLSSSSDVPACYAIFVEGQSLDADLSGQVEQGTLDGAPQDYLVMRFNPRPVQGNPLVRVICPNVPSADARITFLWEVLTSIDGLTLRYPLRYNYYRTDIIDLATASGGVYAGTITYDLGLAR